MIPVLFNKEETTFTSLGLGEIDATVVEVERERNGIYSLYMELPFSSDYVALIEQEMQIKADAGARTKWQTFKVNRVIKDTDKKIVKVYADHISMDTINDAMRPRVAIRQQTAEGALRQWNANRISAKQYDVSSDITTVSGTTWTIDEVENARQALGGVEGSILDVWGGEFEFDNNRIILHKEMGREAPTVLEYGRNIVSLEYEELIDGVYTSIYPYASYTPRSEDNRQQEPVMVTLDELIVDGDYAGNYENKRFQIVDFSSEFDSSGDNPEIPTQTKLRSLAKSYVKANEVGAPKITQEVDFIDLSRTLDYQDMRVMEEIELNDRVPIFYPNIKITSGVKVTKTVWQPLIDQYKSITVSTIGALKSSSLNSDLKTSIKDLEKQQKQINNTVPYLINGQGNRIWYTMPDDTLEHKLGDTWLKKNGKYTIIYQWNGSMWAEIINNETFSKELEAKFKELDRKTQEMTTNISNADNKANDALDKVSLNAELIEEHKNNLESLTGETIPAISKDIQDMREDLGEASRTAKSSLELIGIDRGSFYSKNRRLGAKSQTIQKGDTAEILHNGYGFEVGKVYTLSFKAECIIGDIIERVERTRTETIPFERVVQYSDTLRPDESYVQTAGVNGQATYAWQVETVNGVETGKRTNEIRTSYSPPVNEIYIQGTKTTSTVNFTIRRKLQDLSEARIVQIGDSITMGYGRDIKIPDVVKSELGAQSVQNAGYGSTTASLHPTKPELRKIGFTKLVDSIVSGNWAEALNADLSSITYATPQTYKNSLTALSNTDFSSIDAVIIMYGTNDWAMDVKLDNSSDKYDQNTYLGALRYGINKLQQAYPHLKILVAQPILWTMGSMTSESYNNGISLKVRDYANALNNSLNMDVPVAQIYNKGITTSNYTNYFNTGDSSDGTHPNSAGNAIIGKLVASEFERLIDISPAPTSNSTVNFDINKSSTSTVNFDIIKSSASTVNFEINKGG